jgi:hypothetical protein
MSLNYALYPNKVSKEKDIYRALIKNGKKHTLDDVLDRMDRHKSTIARFEAQASISLFIEVVEEILEEGGSVYTPLFNAKCSVSGNFKGLDDRFSPSRHKINVHLKPGERLKSLAKVIKPQKVKGGLPAPVIREFTDMSSGSTNSILTPGGPAIIRGEYLQFDITDIDQGIYFAVDETTIYKTETIHRNTFSQLVILIPNGLVPGLYRLQVISKLKTQTLRTGEFKIQLKMGQG